MKNDQNNPDANNQTSDIMRVLKIKQGIEKNLQSKRKLRIEVGHIQKLLEFPSDKRSSR